MNGANQNPTEEEAAIQRELDRANAGFEEFVSMAAHNMRESLRDVAAYSQLMAETYAGRLDSDADVFLGRIQEGTARVQSLLTDVVDYWSAGTGDRQTSRTEMEAVLHQALLRVDAQMIARNARITHTPLPAVWGDAGLLTKVLAHLIENAIEYSGRPDPCVHISSKQVELDWVFAIEDNGPGIEPEYKERIFGVFKRLHGKEHPGDGLGLSFCKKAIEWQGGRIWLDSKPGSGATFYFSLPEVE